MLMVGLTGGIASGKSLVARVLRDNGAHVIDADRIVHELLGAGQESAREIAGHFGAAFLLPDGSVDRRRLGEVVFRDAAERDWLNRCIHPRVFSAFQARVQHLRQREPGAIVVLDAALLVETGYHLSLDRLIVVYATLQDQLARLRERDRLTEEQAMLRIASQMPLDEKRKHADYVIDNTGTREDAERQSLEVFEKLRLEARRST